MEPKDIRELIELISKSDFSNFELEKDGFKIKLTRGDSGPVVRTSIREHGVPPPAAAESSVAPVPPPASVEEHAARDGLKVLNSPIVGTFYRAPGPDAEVFTEVGAKIKKGQVVCIVEAMKVMNEIESEIDAEVVEIIVSSGQPVEFGDPLFLLRPL